jgi:hypothetical protein
VATVTERMRGDPVRDQEAAMEDRDILDVIHGLVAEEHWLREQREKGVIEADAESGRLHEIALRLDEMWARLRKRRALRAAGLDPDEVDLRGTDVIAS